MSFDHKSGAPARSDLSGFFESDHFRGENHHFSYGVCPVTAPSSHIRTITKRLLNMVEAGGVEPPSLAQLPAATTCLVREDLSAARWRPNSNPAA